MDATLGFDPTKLSFGTKQLGALFEFDRGIMWSWWKPEPRPCFNLELLGDIDRYFDFLQAREGKFEILGQVYPIDYVVLASGTPEIFNLGGDLDLFRRAIHDRDRDALAHYGNLCIRVLHRHYTAHGSLATTISLVQGECLGGGFEAALASDVIIAEAHSRFGFPEILFNLFPGMGAYSFLSRKVGVRTAEQIITSGKIYTADEMKALGVIDRVVAVNDGVESLREFTAHHRRARNGRAGLAAAARHVHAITYTELWNVVDLWTDCAMRLTPRDLKLMNKLVARQAAI